MQFTLKIVVIHGIKLRLRNYERNVTPMNTTLDWNAYLDRLPGAPKDNQIAAAADIAPSTVSRWRNGQDPRPMHAVSVARAFGNHPLGALNAAGYLTLEEIDNIVDGMKLSALLSLDTITTVELANEVARRLNQGE